MESIPNNESEQNVEPITVEPNSIENEPKKHSSVKIKENDSIESNSEEQIYEVEDETFCDEDFISEFGGYEEDIHSIRFKKIPQVKENESELHPLDKEFFNFDTFEWGIESFDTMDTVVSYEGGQLEIDPKKGFFDKLGGVPEVDDISVDLDDIERKKPILDASISLLGKFVDPLTGTRLSGKESDESILTSDKKMDIEELVEDESKTEELSETSFEDFDSRFPQPIRQTIIQEVTQEDVTLMFAEQALDIRDKPIIIHIPITKAIDFEDDIKKFLETLIINVMRYCDDEHSMQLIRDKLNKSALFHELKISFMDIDVERRVNQFLLRKCAEHHRRKGNFRYLQEERPERILSDMAIYQEKIENLNHLLGKEQQTSRDINKKILDLSLQADEAEEETKEEVVTFENLVKKTIKCEANSNIEKLINKSLHYMTILRDEISSARAIIIQRQHTLGALKQKMHELEYIGDGLCVADYESLQQDVQALGKKIEDRNQELVKMHYRFHHNLHSMSHMKLKSDITIENNEQQKNNLEELEEEERRTREVLFKLNIKHKNTRHKLLDTSLQSGLLDKPALLRDYDETYEKLITKQKKIQELKRSHIKLEEKLKHLQKTQEDHVNKTTAGTVRTAKSTNLIKSKSLNTKSDIIVIGEVQGISLNF